MRALIISLLAVFIVSFALAEGKDGRRHHPPTPSQAVRPSQNCGQPYQRPQQRQHAAPRCDDGRRPITLGSILHDIFSTPIVVVEERPNYYQAQQLPQYVPYPSPSYGGYQYSPPQPISVWIANNPNGRITLATMDHSPMQVWCRGEYILMGELPGTCSMTKVARVSVDSISGDAADVNVIESYQRFAVGDRYLMYPYHP